LFYQEFDSRPYRDQPRIDFILKKGLEAPDTLGSDLGIDGGVNPNGWLWPPVTPSPGETGASKHFKAELQSGSRKGPVDSGSGTDSDEDEVGSDVHKLAKLQHAVHLGQPITVVLKGEYEWKCWHEVQVHEHYQGVAAQLDIMHPLQAAYQAIRRHAMAFGGGDMARSCRGTSILTEKIEVSLAKFGKGVRIIYKRADQKGRPVESMPLACKVEFTDNWALVFGTEEERTDLELTERLEYITSMWIIDRREGRYGKPWEIKLSSRPW
jgi:hypothetical protein